MWDPSLRDGTGGRLPLSSRKQAFGKWNDRGRVSDIMAGAEMGNEFVHKVAV